MNNTAKSTEKQKDDTNQFLTELAEHHLTIQANKIAYVMASEKINEDAKAAFASVILNASNESDANISITHPELIKIALPMLIKSFDLKYGKAIHNSLGALLESSLVYPIEDELQQFEKRFESREELENLATQLSELMHNPNLPKEIKDALEDELNSNHIDFYTPENIVGNLRELRQKEAR